jgi:geranylgeranyl diphosphate synthase type II
MSKIGSMQNHIAEKYLKKLKKRVDVSLRQNLPHDNSKISQAMRYAVLGAGKRIRPALFIAAFEGLGGRVNKAVMNIACAIEFIHTFSLIQDDLPSMDNDDYRRGRLTVHKVYREDTAILSSDALLNEAYDDVLKDGMLKMPMKEAILSELINAVKTLLLGQEKDLRLAEIKRAQLSRLNEIYLYKTAALISVCIRIAGIIRGLKDNQLKILDSFGKKIGLAFQIQDDILNETADIRLLRAKKFSDRRKGKITYASVAGVERSKKIAENLIRKAKKDLEKIKHMDKERLYGICDDILRRTY